jgi:hypothetical protein
MQQARTTLPQKQKEVPMCLLQCTSRVAGLGAAEPGFLVEKRTTFIGFHGNPVAVALVQSVLSVVLVVLAVFVVAIVAFATGLRTPFRYFLSLVFLGVEIVDSFILFPNSLAGAFLLTLVFKLFAILAFFVVAVVSFVEGVGGVLQSAILYKVGFYTRDDGSRAGSTGKTTLTKGDYFVDNVRCDIDGANVAGLGVVASFLRVVDQEGGLFGEELIAVAGRVKIVSRSGKGFTLVDDLLEDTLVPSVHEIGVEDLLVFGCGVVRKGVLSSLVVLETRTNLWSFPNQSTEE